MYVHNKCIVSMVYLNRIKYLFKCKCKGGFPKDI